MIPIGDSTARQRTPWVNYLLIALTALVFLFELSLGRRVDVLIHLFGVTPAHLVAALTGDLRVAPGVFVTLLTATFLHAGWLHLGSNMLFLWVFGDNVEDRLGHARYLLFYLAAGAGAALAQVAADPSSRVPLVGASGAIAGVLGAYVVLYPTAWISVLVPVLFLLLPVNVPVVLMLGLWFVTQLLNGVAAITAASQATGGVGWWAHVGGFVLGIALLLLIPKPARRAPLPVVRAAAAGAVPGWLTGGISLAGNLVGLALVARIALLALVPAEPGLLRSIIRLVVTLTWPLVEPFTRLLPVVSFDGAAVELYAVLALLVYHLAFATLLWLLGLVATPRPQRYHQR